MTKPTVEQLDEIMHDAGVALIKDEGDATRLTLLYLSTLVDRDSYSESEAQALHSAINILEVLL